MSVHLTLRIPIGNGYDGGLARVAVVTLDALLVAVRDAPGVQLARLRGCRVVADVTSDG